MHQIVETGPACDTAIVGVPTTAVHLELEAWADPKEAGFAEIVQRVAGAMNDADKRVCFVLARAETGPRILAAFVAREKLTLTHFTTRPLAHAQNQDGGVIGFVVAAGDAAGLQAELADFAGSLPQAGDRISVPLAGMFGLTVTDARPRRRNMQERAIAMASATAARLRPHAIPLVACGPYRNGRYALFLVVGDTIKPFDVMAEDVDEDARVLVFNAKNAEAFSEWMTHQVLHNRSRSKH